MKDTSSEIVYMSGTYTSTFDSITLSSYVTLKLHGEREYSVKISLKEMKDPYITLSSVRV